MLFPQSRRGVIFAIVGFTAGTLFFSAFLGFDLPAYYSNVHDMSKWSHPAVVTGCCFELPRVNIPFIVLACVPLLLVLRQLVSRAVRERRLTIASRIAAGALGMLLLGAVVCSMNNQDIGMPLAVLAAGAVCETARREESPANSTGRATSGNSRYVVGCMAALVSFLPVIALDLAAIGLSLQWKIALSRHPAENAVLHSAILQDFVCPARSGQVTGREEVAQAILQGEILTPHYMTAYLNEGIDLVKPQVGPADRVYCMDKLNLFPLALGIPYAVGDTGEHSFPT